jgi:hypothetical protein
MRRWVPVVVSIVMLFYIIVGLRMFEVTMTTRVADEPQQTFPFVVPVATTVVTDTVSNIENGAMARVIDDAKFGFESSHLHRIERRFAPSATLVNAKGRSCPASCPRNKPDSSRQARYVAAIVKLRIYDDDPARLTAAEVVQWIQFHRIAGVDQIFLCDSYESVHETVLPHIWPLVESGVVEYYNFSEFAAPHVSDPLIAQSWCYAQVAQQKGFDYEWVMTTDIDEYVATIGGRDNGPGFIRRRLMEAADNVSTVVLENFLMQGLFDDNEELLIKRVKHRNKEAARGQRKYFTRPARTSSYDVHHPEIQSGIGIVNRSALSFLHVWGPRAFGFGAASVPFSVSKQLLLDAPVDEVDEIVRVLRECATLCTQDEFHWRRKAGPPFWQALRQKTG